MYASRRVLDRFGHMIGPVEGLHHASDAVTASNRGPYREYAAVSYLTHVRHRCREKRCLRHRSEDASGERECGVSRRVLERFGFRIALMGALHHTIPAEAVSNRAVKWAVNILRCRK